MRAFRDVLERDVPYEIPPRQENRFNRLCSMGYVFVKLGETPTVTIPEELRRLSASVLTDALEETRRRVQWGMACLNEIVPSYWRTTRLA